MNYYKVRFKDNIPTNAERLLNFQADDIVHISEKEGKTIIEWLTVSADDEKQAIEEAAILLKLYIMPWWS
jgi:hypothetical protein